ncbi:MAG: hypothetical protein IE922_09670 [Sphingomonadales bacterium]|nr:hypothetical protein [Sphingomonadales bacterium]
MLKTTGKKAALVGLLVTSALAALPVLPAWAQSAAESARSGVLSLGIGIESGKNIALQAGADDVNTELTSRLGYDYTMKTATSALSFGVSVNPSLRDGEDTVPLPRAELRFSQTWPRHELTLEAQYQRSRVSDQAIGYDQAGSIVYYDGSGQRSFARIGAQFTGGIDMPFGYSLGLSHTETDYHDTLPGSQTPTRRSTATLGLRADLSAMTQARFALSHDLYEADNADNLTRRTDKVSVQLEQRIDAVTTLGFSVGRTRIESERAGLTETTEGTIWGLDLTREDALGSYGLQFERSLTEEGSRDAISLTREAETRLGTFNGMIGASRGAADETDVIAGLGYEMALPRDRLSVDLSRAIRSNDDGEDVVLTRVSGQLVHELSEIAALNFGVTASLTEAPGEETTRVDASVAYNHALGVDADLSAGVRFGLSERTGQADADRQTLFVTLNRRFETLR